MHILSNIKVGLNKIKDIIICPVAIRIYIALIGFCCSVLINKSIGLSLKGQYTTITSYANYGQMLLNLGLCFAYPVIIKKYRDKFNKESLLTIIWIQTFLCILIASIGSIFVNNDTFVFVFLLTTLIICNGQILFIALIDDIKKRNYILLASSCFYLLFCVISFCCFNGSLYVVLYFLMGKYLIEIIIVSIAYKYFVFKPKTIKRDFVKVVFSFGIPAAIMNLLISVNYSIDVLMLNLMNADIVEIGIYGVAYSLSNMLWIIPDAFKEMVYSKSVKNNNYLYVFKYLLISVLICGAVLIGFIFLGKSFLSFFYTEEFVISYKTVIVLFAGVIPMIAFKLIHPIYVNSGKTVLVGIMLLVSVSANIVSSYYLIPISGAYGAALATVISYSVCGVLFLSKFIYDYVLRQKTIQ